MILKMKIGCTNTPNDIFILCFMTSFLGGAVDDSDIVVDDDDPLILHIDQDLEPIA